MTKIIQMQYSNFSTINVKDASISEGIAYDFQYKRDLSIGEHVRLIHGIVGNIFLYFESNVGLHELSRRVWEIKYGFDEFDLCGLLAIRPVGKMQPIKYEDYDHYYNAWAPSGQNNQSRLLVYNQGKIYSVYRRGADTWLYLRCIHQLEAA